MWCFDWLLSFVSTLVEKNSICDVTTSCLSERMPPELLFRIVCKLPNKVQLDVMSGSSVTNYRNEPKRTETHQNEPKRSVFLTETKIFWTDKKYSCTETRKLWVNMCVHSWFYVRSPPWTTILRNGLSLVTNYRNEVSRWSLQPKRTDNNWISL